MEPDRGAAPAPIDLFLLFRRFAGVFRRWWLLIPVLAVLFSLQSYLTYRSSYLPAYECTAVFSVGSSGDAAAAQALPDLLNTEYMRELIAEGLEEGCINGSITASAFEGTNLIRLSVESSDPQDARDILDAVLTACSQAAVYMVEDPAIEMRQEIRIPTAPVNAYAPGCAWIWGGVKGALIGLAAIFCLSLLDQTVSSASELREMLDAPVLAVLPRFAVKKRRNAPVTPQTAPARTEMLRSLRGKVHRLLKPQQGKVILLTSTVHGEGKTTLSIDLARSLASEGHRVVLVDGDLRRQAIARLLNLREQNRGLLRCLRDPGLVSECLQEVPGSALHCISGGAAPKRHYCIDPHALNAVLNTLARRFDYVVVDSSPWGITPDAGLLCRYADCVLYVVRAEGANKMLILDAVTGLTQSKAKLSGIILNGVRPGVIRHDRGHGSQYGSGDRKGYGRRAHPQNEPRGPEAGTMKRILILTNHSFMFWQFRRDLVAALLEKGVDVVIGVPFGDHVADLETMGCRMVNTPLQRRGIDPFRDHSLYRQYRRLLREISPDMVITYSIKPNIYGGYACRKLGIPCCANVQGLGTPFQKPVIARLVTVMYAAALKNAKVVFFENSSDAAFFAGKNITPASRQVILPGAGINLEHFTMQPYPQNGPIRFLYLGRLMKEKGIDELFAAAKRLFDNGFDFRLDLVGFFEEEYRACVKQLTESGFAVFHGFQPDVRPYYAAAHCVVLPSYHEGMSNVLLEAAATGRPVITSDIPGCREAVDIGRSGLVCRAKDAGSLYRAMKEFAQMSREARTAMGIAGRRYVEAHFDKNDVVRQTLRAIYR